MKLNSKLVFNTIKTGSRHNLGIPTLGSFVRTLIYLFMSHPYNFGKKFFDDIFKLQSSPHWAKKGGHMDIQMYHFITFWAREIWWGIEWNALLWHIDEILSLWPRFSFDSYMILGFQAMSTCRPNVQSDSKKVFFHRRVSFEAVWPYKISWK